MQNCVPFRIVTRWLDLHKAVAKPTSLKEHIINLTSDVQVYLLRDLKRNIRSANYNRRRRKQNLFQKGFTYLLCVTIKCVMDDGTAREAVP